MKWLRSIPGPVWPLVILLLGAVQNYLSSEPAIQGQEWVLLVGAVIAFLLKLIQIVRENTVQPPAGRAAAMAFLNHERPPDWFRLIVGG